MPPSEGSLAQRVRVSRQAPTELRRDSGGACYFD